MELTEANVRFALATPPMRRARGSVQVAGALVVEHPQVKHAIVVPLEQIAGFAAGDHLAPDDLAPPDALVLERPLRSLPISSRPGAATNVVIVLRTPTTVGPFRFGTESVFHISGRERRHGLEVDVLLLAVQDEDGVDLALRSAGVRPAPIRDLVREVGGEATGLEREQRLLEAIRLQRRSVRTATAAAVLTTLGLSVRVLAIAADDLDWSAGLVLQVLAASVLVMLLVAAVLRRPGREAPAGPPPQAPQRKLRGPRRYLLAVSLAIACSSAVAVFGDGMARPVVVGLMALGAGGFGGVVLGSVPRLGSRLLPGLVLAVPPHRRRRPLVPIVVMAGAAALFAGIVYFVAPSKDDDLARSAVVSADHLPAGWTTTYSHKFDGDLDDHICGNDDAALPRHVAGFARGFKRPQDHTGTGPVWMDLTVLLARDEAAAATEFAAVESEAYRFCLIERVELMTKEEVADDTGPGRGSFVHRTTPSLDVPAVVDQTYVDYPSRDGTLHQQHVTFVRMQIGRAIVRMPLSSFRGPISEDEVEGLARAVRDEVQLALAAQ